MLQCEYTGTIETFPDHSDLYGTAGFGFKNIATTALEA